MSRILTITTDFGTRDAYVAAMKGAILSIDPHIKIMDVTQEIPAQDIMEAAFVLRDAYRFFPDETVHLVVVDPGVGSSRRPVGVRIGHHTFVGPDNGLFSLLSDEEIDLAVELTNPAFWRADEPCRTFHGRDIFAPVAAHLATGVPLAEMGTAIDDIERLHWVKPIADDEGIRGWIVHIDRFGNCITNIPRELVESHRRGRGLKTYVGTAIIEGLYSAYHEVEPGEPLVLYDSTNHLEIAVKEGSAAELLTIRKSASVNVLFVDGGTAR